MPARLSLICASVRMRRLSSLPEGSPTRCRAAAHQRDRPVAGLLHPVEHHDRQQRADVQRGRRAVEADIGRDRSGLGARVEVLRLRDLVDEAALGENIKKFGLIGAHGTDHSDGFLDGRGWLIASLGRRWCNRSGQGFNRPGEAVAGQGRSAGNRVDERDLARRGRCGAARDRWRGHPGLRADRLPALFGSRARSVAPGARRGRSPDRPHGAARRAGRSRRLRHPRAGRDRREPSWRPSASTRPRSTSSASTARPCCTGPRNG